jgi:hypothetical protein
MPRGSASRTPQALLWIAILAIACALRLPAVQAGLPYLNYIDEGYVLHRVSHLLATGGWDPGWYSYPSLPIYAITAAAYLISPLYTALHGHPLQQDLAVSGYYDLVQPPEILVVGRALTLLASLGIVVLSGLLAGRLAGAAARWWAALVAAALPALVMRGGIVIVDTYAAFFVLATLYFTDRACWGKRPVANSLLAGAMAGWAFTSKYPAAAVFLAVIVGILLAEKPWRSKASMLAAAATAAVAASLVAMPSLALRTSFVLQAIRNETARYSTLAMGSYWVQATQQAEWVLPSEHAEVGLVFLGVAGLGLFSALIDRSRTRRVLGWLVYGSAALLLVTQYPFRPFRNLLPLAPIGCVLVGMAIAAIRIRLRRPVLVDLAAGVVVAWFALAPSVEYTLNRWHLQDSRAEAIDWLVENSSQTDQILFVEEMAFLPLELDRLAGTSFTVSWKDAAAQIQAIRPDFVVLGVLDVPPDAHIALQTDPLLTDGYELQAQFGEHPAPAGEPGWWRANRQWVFVFVRE